MSGTFSSRSVWRMGPGRLRRSPAASPMDDYRIPPPSCHSRWPDSNERWCHMTERIVRASTMRIEKGQVAYDTAMHGESPRRTAATQYTREQHTGAGLLCCLAACSLVKPVFAHVRRGLCPCSISILCHAHSNRVSTGCDHHRLSRAYWHCLHPGLVARWDPHRLGER